MTKKDTDSSDKKSKSKSSGFEKTGDALNQDDVFDPGFTLDKDDDDTTTNPPDKK